jgi:hypothetical protein
MEGRTNEAQRELRRSQTLLPHNVPSQLLSVRLERDATRRLALLDSEIAARPDTERSGRELLVERARILFELNRFQESVAAFDNAFILLEDKPFYSEVYGTFRDKAWELRGMAQSEQRTINFARQDEINWRDLIVITSTETELLRFLTAGRNLAPEAIYTQLLERAFIPHSQNADLTQWPAARPPITEAVLRSGAAWFLWHLNAENRANRGLLTRYSSRFASNPNARSPIPDVPVRSPFIDSVLGCLESEFMSLPDGRNFFPEERVRGAEILAMLNRL